MRGNIGMKKVKEKSGKYFNVFLINLVSASFE